MQLATRRVHSGRVITLDVDHVRFPDGSDGHLELVRHPGAAAVVPIASDPQGGDPTILMIRQYRYATGGTLWEIPAGRLATADEDPAACARRELQEEVGVTADSLQHLTSIWTSPGFTNEKIHLYVATGLKTVPTTHEPDEFIEVVPQPLSRVLEMIKSGDVCDGKTAVGILFVAGYVLGL
jgi:ADP-ribose pyrophosphatase